MSKCMNRCKYYRFISREDKFTVTQYHYCSKNDRVFLNLSELEKFGEKCPEPTPDINYQMLISEILKYIKRCNQQFQLLCRHRNIKGDIILREDFEISSELALPPTNENEFWSRITSLSKIFEVSPNSLRELVIKEAAKRKQNPEELAEKIFRGVSLNNLGSISLLKILATITDDFRYENVYETWRAIRNLRQRSAHALNDKSLEKVVKALKFFGEDYPPKNYYNLWITILQVFLESLRTMSSLLEKLQNLNAKRKDIIAEFKFHHTIIL